MKIKVFPFLAWIIVLIANIVNIETIGVLVMGFFFISLFGIKESC